MSKYMDEWLKPIAYSQILENNERKTRKGDKQMEKEKIKKQIIQMLNKMNLQQLNEIFKITHHFFTKER